jgi:hypothetical protein
MTLTINPILEERLKIHSTTRLEILTKFIGSGHSMLPSQKILPCSPKENAVP